MFEMVLPVGFHTERLEDRYGKFVISPLERGYGDTVGNSIRRILLSSIKGAAIVAVRIKNVLHEFSTIPGVLEEVPIIILNLKRVRLAFDPGIDDRQELYLRAKGKGEVRASAIEVPPGVKIVNPEEYLFSITGDLKDDEIYAELTAMRGKGFIPAESYPDSIKEHFPAGTIFLDGLFNPVKRVSYSVENVRVKAAMDKEKLNLEVWTDGSRNPEEVISEATEIFGQLADRLRVKLEAPPLPSYEERRLRFEQRQRIKAIISQPIESLDLQKRTLTCLKEAGFTTIGDLVVKTAKDMLKIKNFGEKSLKEIREVLEKFNMDFGMDLSEVLREEEEL
ncbi:MAG: DNA-directed RNA polymerase subunit alpha [candidate division WOR-3 bacterium]